MVVESESTASTLNCAFAFTLLRRRIRDLTGRHRDGNDHL